MKRVVGIAVPVLIGLFASPAFAEDSVPNLLGE
jgi:hypothetical protein